MLRDRFRSVVQHRHESGLVKSTAAWRDPQPSGTCLNDQPHRKQGRTPLETSRGSNWAFSRNGLWLQSVFKSYSKGGQPC